MSLRFSRSRASGREALGRSRGGLGTKIVVICDAAGRLVDFLLTPGQAHELAPSLTLLLRLPEAPSWAIAHMACDAAQFRSEARVLGAIPVVPSRRGAKEPQPCPAYILNLPLADRVRSWVGHGENLPVTSEELSAAFTPAQLDHGMVQSGMTPDTIRR